LKKYLFAENLTCYEQETMTREGKRSGWDNIPTKGETTERGKWETTARCRSIFRTRVNCVRETNGISPRNLLGCLSRIVQILDREGRIEPTNRSNWLPFFSWVLYFFLSFRSPLNLWILQTVFVTAAFFFRVSKLFREFLYFEKNINAKRDGSIT